MDTSNASEPTRNKIASTPLYHAEALTLAGKSVESFSELEIVKKLLRKPNTLTQPSALEIPGRAQLLIYGINAKLHVSITAKEREIT